MPKRSIECAFGYAPFTASPAWTDITQWVEAFLTKRGRQHELQRFEAGTAQLTLNNQDGRFSQWNTGSPYAGDLVPSTPIRITATWGGTTYPVFYGFVDSWIPQYGQVRSQQVIKATDGMQLLALAYLDKAVYVGQIVADGAAGYWQLADAIGSPTAADSSGNGYTGNVSIGAVTFGVAGPLLTSVATGATFGGGQIVLPPTVSGSHWSLEAWFKSPVGSGSYGVLSAGINAALLVSGGFPEVFTPSGSVTGPTTVCDGNWHHLVATQTGTTVSLYVDGALAGTVASTSALASGQTGYIGAGGSGNTLAQVAIYPTALTATQVADHYELGSVGWVTPQYSGQRIGAVLDIFGWPSALQNLDTGISQVQASQSALNQTAALSYIQTVEATEQGMFFVDESGNATFLDRHYILTALAATTSNGTFSNAIASGHHYFLPGSLVPASDELDLWTDVPASRQNGVIQQSVNEVAAALLGYRTLTGFTGLLQESDTEVLALTQWLLAHYDTPISRVRSIAVDNTAQAGANFPQMLGRKLMDRITVDWKPIDATTSRFTQDSLIESVQHDVTQESWKTTWGLTPAETQPYFVLNDPTLGTLNSNRLAY